MGMFFIDQKTQQILRLLLLCHICELQDNKYTIKTERIRYNKVYLYTFKRVVIRISPTISSEQYYNTR